MKDLHELKLIRELTHFTDDLIQSHELDRVTVEGSSFPIIGFTIGSQDKSKPALGLFGGVHGLERVGSHVVITYLTSLFKQLSWDEDLRRRLEDCRIVSIPLINPAGMALHQRSNPNGVDIMRNAPVDCEEESTFLVSGHRFSSKLPWYRGEKGKPMEVESQALVDFCRDQLFEASAAVTVDFHSGFGMKDRLWFPYAKTSVPFPNIRQVENLKDILDETLPHHIYHVEPQADSYTINGDLWDYIYDLHLEHNKETPEKTLIPWTLEMGSWIWVKKNPLQIFSSGGFFNPIKSHRYDRTMRRHLLLIDFLFRAARNFPSWI